jgi:hypothetical protein
MKKQGIIAFILATVSAVCFTSCGEQEIPHECVWLPWQETIAPSCEEKGLETRYCADDPTHFEEREVDELGHSIEEWFSLDGGHTGFCGECGKDTAWEAHDFKNGKCAVCGEREE